MRGGPSNCEFVASIIIVDGRVVLTSRAPTLLAPCLAPSARYSAEASLLAISFVTIVEHVAWEAGKSADDILTSRRPYLIWLRRAAVWLARASAELDHATIVAALGNDRHRATLDWTVAQRLRLDDGEFRRLTDIVASALAGLIDASVADLKMAA